VHEGVEWIDSGALVERVNFVAKELSDVKSPGVRSIIDRLEAGADDGVLNPSDLADGCLDLLGPIQVSDETRLVLVDYAARLMLFNGISAIPVTDAKRRLVGIVTWEDLLCHYTRH
jgi:CBS-domain-containing membrane protein